MLNRIVNVLHRWRAVLIHLSKHLQKHDPVFLWLTGVTPRGCWHPLAVPYRFLFLVLEKSSIIVFFVLFFVVVLSGILIPIPSFLLFLFGNGLSVPVFLQLKWAWAIWLVGAYFAAALYSVTLGGAFKRTDNGEMLVMGAWVLTGIPVTTYVLAVLSGFNIAQGIFLAGIVGILSFLFLLFSYTMRINLDAINSKLKNNGNTHE